MIGKASLWVLAVLAGLSVEAFAQQGGENSIPAPTALGALAADPQSEIALHGDSISVESARAAISLSAVEVTRSDIREFGVQAELRSEEQSETLYLDHAQASQLSNELARFDRWPPQMDAGGHRVFGVARCRPSQSTSQAFCPAMYSIEDEKGVAISTSLAAYRFPDMEPSELVAALESVLDGLSGIRTE